MLLGVLSAAMDEITRELAPARSTYACAGWTPTSW